MHVQGIGIARDDVVSVVDRELVVQSCTSIDAKLCLLVNPLARVSAVTSSAWKCKVLRDLHIVDCAAHVIRQVTCWTFEADGQVVVLL